MVHVGASGIALETTASLGSGRLCVPVRGCGSMAGMKCVKCGAFRLVTIVLALIPGACAQGASSEAAGAGGNGPAASTTVTASSTASAASSGASTGGSGSAGAGGGMVDAGTDAGPPPPELVAWYRFEDAAQPKVLDSSIYGN